MSAYLNALAEEGSREELLRQIGILYDENRALVKTAGQRTQDCLALERRLRQGADFWYLATPYSKYPHGIEAAFELACAQAAELIKAGVRVYSPIAHTHPVAIHGGIDPYDHRIWLPADEPFMHAAKGLIVLRAEGWATSYGISEEIKAFAAAGKPIVYMDPGAVPVEISEVR